MTISNEDLSTLGYSFDWIEIGILSEEDVLEQNSIFEDSDDKNQEHYRHQSFKKFLKTKTQLSDAEVESIIKLQDYGEDGTDLSTERAISLLVSDLLSREQLLSLARFDSIKDEPLAKIYKRELFLSDLVEFGFTDKTFEEIQNSEDALIQRMAIESLTLSKEQVIWLTENGLSKKIRNLAKNRLGSREFKWK